MDLGRQGGPWRDRAYCRRAEELSPWFAALVAEFVLFGVLGKIYSHINARVIYTLYQVKQERGLSSRRQCSHKAQSSTRAWVRKVPSAGASRGDADQNRGLPAHVPALEHAALPGFTRCGYLCGWGRTPRPGREGSGWGSHHAPSCCSTERSTAGSRPPRGPAESGSQAALCSHAASSMSARRKVSWVHPSQGRAARKLTTQHLHRYLSPARTASLTLCVSVYVW